MTNRQNLIEALEGRKPEHIPFTVNEEFLTDDSSWKGLFEKGLCPIPYTSTVSDFIRHVERTEKTEVKNGHKIQTIILGTPLGEISQVSVDGWINEYYLKKPEDYKIMEYIVRNSELKLKPESFSDAENRIGEKGITLIGAGRSPMQTILVDFAGVEGFCIHLAEGFQELYSLEDALMDQLMERCRLIAAGPGRYVSLLENFTAEIWGPQRFMKYHMPVYKKIIPILHSGGKKIYSHFDGKLECVSKLIAAAEIDGIESLTSPPEGDMTYKDARKAWPDKFIWANINTAYYNLPEKELRDKVSGLARQAAPDGCNLAFEISEDLPENWRESIPAVLDSLME